MQEETGCVHLTYTWLGKGGRNTQRTAVPFSSPSGQVNTVILGILTLKPGIFWLSSRYLILLTPMANILNDEERQFGLFGK